MIPDPTYDIDNLTVDVLRCNHYESYFFGLGFVQVKVDQRRRFHFYHPSLPALVDDPHDHRYDFFSNVIRGGLQTTIWEVRDGGVSMNSKEFVMEHETCKQDGQIEVPPGENVTAWKIGSFMTHEGSEYYMQRDVFHQVRPLFEIGPVVTYITRCSIDKQLARVLHDPSAEKVCPFSKKIDEAEMWDIVEDCLERK